MKLDSAEGYVDIERLETISASGEESQERTLISWIFVSVVRTLAGEC